MVRVAAAAENAGFTLLTLEDGALPPGATPDAVGRIGAVERAAFLAASTSVIGIAPVVPVTYAEPFHISSQLASLDHISAGRAGWVVSEEARPEAARAWDRPSSTAPPPVPASPATASRSSAPCGTPGRTTRSSAPWPPAATSTATGSTTSTSPATPMP
ncbi:LLM class flavin-dependent oxidoreductase [Streptomyces sp. S1D4-11]